MIKMISLVFALSFSYFCSATEALTKEALTSQLSQIQIDSPKRIPVLVKLVNACWYKCADDAIVYGEEALSLLDKYPNQELEASMLGYYQRIYLDRGEDAIVEKLLIRGIAAAKQGHNEKSLTNNLYNQAIFYSRNSKSVLALDTYFQLEKSYQRTESFRSLGNLYNNIGNVYLKLENYGKALVYYQKAGPLVNQYGRKSSYANILMNIGQVYINKKDYQQALINIQQGFELVDESSPLQYTEAHLRLSNIYRLRGDIEKAYQYFYSAEVLALKYNFNATLLTLYFNTITLALDVNDLTLADILLDKIHQSLSVNLPKTYHQAFGYYAGSIAIKKQQWLKAESFLDPLVNDSQLEQNLYDALALANKLSLVKEQLGKFEEANKVVKLIFEHYRKLVDMNNRDQAEQYAQLYKSSEQEKKIAKLEEKNTQQSLDALLVSQEKEQLIFLQVVIIIVFIFLLLFVLQRRYSLIKQAKLSKQLIVNKNQMLADISHELRTPFSVLKLQVEALQYNIEEDKDKAHIRLQNKINQLTRLISDIDELAQADSLLLELHKQEVNIHNLIYSSCDEMLAAIETAGLTLKLENKLPLDLLVSIDVSRIKQVITNLLGNSIRYTEAPGRIVITAFTKKDMVIIHIEDTSPTVPAKELNAIFDRLYRVEKSRSRETGGTGLGLSICRSLVELHHGKIKAEQSSLGGLKLKISIPI